MSNISHILIARAASQPDAPALTQRRGEADLTMTFGSLESAVRREARRLSRARIARGDRVLMLCPVGIELYVTLLALLRIGAVATSANPRGGLRPFAASCQLANVRVVMGGWRARALRLLVPTLRREARWLRATKLDTGHDAAANDTAVTDVAANDAAIVTFTSGSTGQPKGMVRSHGYLEAQQRAITHELQLREGQVDLSTMPMFVLANLGAGVHSILADGDVTQPARIVPAKLIAQMVRHQPDRLLAAPSLLERMADECLRDGRRLPSLRRVDTGGAPVFPRVLDKLRQVMPHAQLMVVYGSTEAEPIAMLDATTPDATLRERMRNGEGLAAGTLATDIDVRLMQQAWGKPLGPFTEEQFATRCVQPGEVGEIVAQGERVIRGYLNGVGDAETKFVVGTRVWHRTGDLGRIDANGKLWLLGRAAARIVDSRGSVEPFAVEAAAMEHSAVARCALLAVDGQRVLVVERNKDAPAGWEAELRESFAWAGIDQVRAIARMPLDARHASKVDYPALRRLVGASASA